MKAIPCILLVCLTGCVSPQQEAARQAADERSHNDSLDYRCRSFGFQPNTPEHGQCMMQLYQGAQANRAAMGAALIGSGALNPQPFRPMPNFPPMGR